MNAGVPDVVGGQHVCAVYRSHDEWTEIVETYLASAKRAGFVGVVFDREQAAAVYGDRPTTDPHGLAAELAFFADTAVAGGNAGFAIAVDVTGFVLTPQSRASFARAEHLADRTIRSHGAISGLCLYDARTIGAAAVAELAVLHERVVPADTPFHLCALGERAMRLDGELDLVSHAGFELALAAVASTADGDVVVDVTDLAFIDVWSLHEFERRGRASRRRFVLEGARPIVRRLVEASRLEHVVIGGAT